MQEESKSRESLSAFFKEAEIMIAATESIKSHRLSATWDRMII